MTYDAGDVKGIETTEIQVTPETKPEDTSTENNWIDTQKIKQVFEAVLNERDFVTRDALREYVTKQDLDNKLTERIAPLSESIIKLTSIMKELSDSQRGIDELNAKLDTFIKIRTTEVQTLQDGHEKQMEQIKRNQLAIEKNADQIKVFSNALFGENGVVALSQDFRILRPKLDEMYTWHNAIAGTFRKWNSWVRTRTGGATTIAAIITVVKLLQTLDIDAIGNLILSLIRLLLVAS